MADNNDRGQEFLVGGVYAFALYSGWMSSPWTVANVGADQEHAATANQLINWATIAAVAATGYAAYLDRSWYALAGGVAVGLATIGLYRWAMGKAVAKGYQGLNTHAGDQAA